MNFFDIVKKYIKVVPYAIIIVMIICLLKSCENNSNLIREAKMKDIENARLFNNEVALYDSIRTYKATNGKLISEKYGYELSLKELNTKYDFLLKDFDKLKKVKAKAVVNFSFINTEKIDSIPVFIGKDSIGRTNLKFVYERIYDSANWRKLNGEIPYEITYYKKDSSQINLSQLGVYSKFKPSKAKLNLTQGMSFSTGLFKEDKTGKILIKVTTDYPGVEITNIEGASIMDNPDSRKVVRQMRKQWGIGMGIGYGVFVDKNIVKVGPQAHIGINYTPKWLQF